MARTRLVKNYNNLLGGYITQGNEFAPPENAIRDGLNVEIQRTGGVRRRKGINKEATATADNSKTETGAAPTYINMTWDWHSANGDQDKNFVIVQRGNYLRIYEKGQSSDLASNFHTEIDMDSYFFTGSSYSTTYENPVQISIVQGFAVVTGVGILPFIITYSVSGDSFSVSASGARSQIRDYEGVNDTYDVDERVLAYTLNYDGQTSNFTVGATLTNTSSGATAKILADVDNGTDGTLTLRILTSGSWANNTAITDDSGGAADCNGSLSGVGLSDEHQYNLLNQGWSQDNMDTYAGATGYWPSNAQIWYAGKDSSGDFDPDLLDKTDFGTTLAPRGHFIIDNTDRTTSRETVSGVDLTAASPDDSESRCSAVFAGRVFQAGWLNQKQQSMIAFSPILTENDTDGVPKHYQKNDPTSEFLNSPLATDGGYLIIPDTGTVHRLVALDIALLVFAENGVWTITGPDIYSGFTATAYSVKKITDIGTRSPNSVVFYKNSAIYWAREGIIAIEPGENPGFFKTVNLTQDTIDDVYTGFDRASKEKAIGYYDTVDKKIYWSFRYDQTLTNGEYRDAMLIFDTKLGVFLPLYQTAQVDDDKSEDPMFGGFTQDPFYDNGTGVPTLKVCTHKHNVSGNAITFNFAEFRDEDFIDWLFVDSTGEYFDSYLEPWADHLGAPDKDKQAVYVYCYFEKTEDGFEDNGSGGLVATHQSGCLMRGKWEWHNTATGGRWSEQKQAYRFQRVYIPEDVNDPHDSGVSIVETKNKVRGKGKALAIRFDSQDGKDFVLLGYSIPYEAVLDT